MKIKKLTIHNIASIEDAVIDFDAKPLAECEVFLITGKTGAGKSTILDAICLALYADTPRLYNTKMQGATLDADKEVKIDDPRQLMRRNTTEAFVSLTFTGSNKVNYEAIWSVARSYKRVNGTIKNKSWQLTNLGNNTTLTKDVDIKAEIKAAVGLDFNQFCRTTLLAQGEFTRFLNSKDDDKAEILEKITGVDVYSKIGAKVFELTNKKRQEWEEATRLIDGIHSLSETEIADKMEAIATLDAQSIALKKLVTEINTKRQWLKSETDLKKGLDEAAENLRLAKETLESNEFKLKEDFVKEWHATIDARGWLRNMDKAKENGIRLNLALNNLKEKFSTIISGQEWVTQEIKRIKEKLEDLNALTEKEKDKAAIYEKAQAIAGLLSLISEGRKIIRKTQEKLESDNKAMEEEYEPALEKTYREIETLHKEIEAEETEVKQIEEEVAILDLPGLHTQRDAIKEVLAKISIAKERIATLKQEEKRKENIEKNLEEKRSAIEEKKKFLSELVVQVHDAKLKMDTCKELLDKQKDTVDKFARALRLKLHIGDTCPICRQEIRTELPHEEELSSLVMGLQESYNKAEKEFSKINESKVVLDAGIETEWATYQKEKSDFEKDNTVMQAQIRARKACIDCGIDRIDAPVLSLLKEIETNKSVTQQNLDIKIGEGVKKEEILKKKRTLLEALRKKENLSARKAREKEDLLNECKRRIDTAKALIQTKREEVENSGTKVAGWIGTNEWEIDWHVDPDAFSSALIAAAKTFYETMQKQQKGTALLEQEKIFLKSVTDTKDAILRMIPAWDIVASASVAKVDNLHSLANELNSEVAAIISQKQDATNIYTKSKELLDTFLIGHQTIDLARLALLDSHSSEKIREENAQLDNVRKLFIAQKTLFNSATRQYEEHLLNKPPFSENESLDTLDNELGKIEKELSEAGERKGAINQELKNDAENKLKLGTLITKADEKKNVYLKWSRLNQLIGNATGNTFRKIAQSYVLASLVQSANSYMKMLTDRYTLKVNPGTFVISIEDAYQGYTSRAASTISGGESFLVSLSLALALSDIGQQWQVDTLFIDEGFGTLSGEPLLKAIETLRSLHSKSGRHVGIISHVEELQERIPVQIQVVQEGNNSSSEIIIKS